MKKHLSLFFISFLFFPLPAFAAEVKNVNSRQEGNRMLFEYDLVGDESDAEVQLTVTVKGQVYPMDKLHLEGDAGKVKVGKGKKIWWNILQDFPRGYAGDLEWELVAGAKKFKDSITGMEFVFVKGGCFQMGDTFGDGGSDEKPVHEVCVDDFYMGIYGVTQAQWERVMGGNPSHFKKGGNYPVEEVTWNDVQNFIERLNGQSGKNYRLPTEAEWEYAARSGGKREWYAGTSSVSDLGDYAWYSGNSGGSTHPVGEKRPNGLGLYDMSGNVWEWCADWYAENYYSSYARDNPKGPGSGSTRVLRGGSWVNSPRNARAAYRAGLSPSNGSNTRGFRLALSPK